MSSKNTEVTVPFPSLRGTSFSTIDRWKVWRRSSRSSRMAIQSSRTWPSLCLTYGICLKMTLRKRWKHSKRCAYESFSVAKAMLGVRIDEILSPQIKSPARPRHRAWSSIIRLGGQLFFLHYASQYFSAQQKRSLEPPGDTLILHDGPISLTRLICLSQYYLHDPWSRGGFFRLLARLISYLLSGKSYVP